MVQSCDELLNQNTRLLTLGGDHSISYPILRSYAKFYPDLTILHIDAHTGRQDVHSLGNEEADKLANMAIGGGGKGGALSLECLL